ncbi:hypothetical protein GY45DRAFT_1066581 [Cubamyces sp. BRFM 1775]|nr:hypothetical protein GY45DRAFT_1066581 [Cubamyces sp. BRFM 1775]
MLCILIIIALASPAPSRIHQSLPLPLSPFLFRIEREIPRLVPYVRMCRLVRSYMCFYTSACRYLPASPLLPPLRVRIQTPTSLRTACAQAVFIPCHLFAVTALVPATRRRRGRPSLFCPSVSPPSVSVCFPFPFPRYLASDLNPPSSPPLPPPLMWTLDASDSLAIICQARAVVVIRPRIASRVRRTLSPSLPASLISLPFPKPHMPFPLPSSAPNCPLLLHPVPSSSRVLIANSY